ncbi:MAG: TonB-dependent receptor [Caulobacteraceae bacterium]
MISRHLLLAAASASALLATSAFAQDAAPADEVEAVVVTGTRAAPRSRLDSIAPVDVVTAQQISRGGTTELAQALSFALPSLNFTRPAVTDGSDTVRPATLRGLSPDQTLVLINSKRAHAASLVNLNGAIGYGSGAVDLNTIPVSAIGTIEVLRDGASAQYGSDAIAGVINFRLREARSGGGISVTVGEYVTDVNYRPSPSPIPGVTIPTSRNMVDGQTTTVSGWTGLPIGSAGFLTVSAESKVQSHTTRAGPDPRQQYPFVNGVAGAYDPRELGYDRFNNWYGDPQLEQYTFFANAGYDLNSNVHLYGWGSFQSRDAISAANVRRAIQANAGSNVLSVYPDGFLPKIEGKVYDGSAAGGATFKTGDWNWDASVVYGVNEFNFGVIDSINASIGPTSQKSFDAGALRYQQVVGNLGVTRTMAFAGLSEVNFAAGGEVRYERYQILPGEPASYINGGFFTQTTPTAVLGGTGSQSFSGFSPANATDQNRTSESAYVDVSTKVLGALDIDVAGRYEHYSDFGSVATGKLALRYDLTPNFALRGAVSNGFRAPSLQQSFITTTSTNFVAGVPIQTILLASNNPVARFIGAVALKPEKSTNLSAGAVFRAGAFSATIDSYIIRINNRIVLSDILSQGNVIGLFPASAQIGGVRFFTNGADTTTTGQEAVVSYHFTPEANLGRFDLTASASHNETHIRALRSTPQLSSLNPAPPFLTPYRVTSLTYGQPKWKGSFVVDWNRGPLGMTAKATYYGKLIQAFSGGPLGNYPLAAKTLLDLEARVKVVGGVQLAFGAENILDTYPTTVPYVLNGQNISTNGVQSLPEYSPFGFQGRYVYARASYNW